MSGYDLHERAAAIIADAGGELVGRTRLQKVTYLSYLAGLVDGFGFEYKHYGPFSEELADAVQLATGLKLIKEDERRTEWGGWYSVFKSQSDVPQGHPDRTRFLAAAVQIGALELELAATAAFLHVVEGYGKNGFGDPWEETARRKPEKAGQGRMERAKKAYKALSSIVTPVPLPQIA